LDGVVQSAQTLEAKLAQDSKVRKLYKAFNDKIFDVAIDKVLLQKLNSIRKQIVKLSENEQIVSLLEDLINLNLQAENVLYQLEAIEKQISQSLSKQN
jgi:hypothetical protein